MEVNWLGQGTVYPDVIESVSATGGPSAKIKSHHNVGGLPENEFKVIEPLKKLKDEVRRVGQNLGLDKNILFRHPFPGPGLAIRILVCNKTNLSILREVDCLLLIIKSMICIKMFGKLNVCQ